VASSSRTTPKLYTSTFSFAFLVYAHSAEHNGQDELPCLQEKLELD
jgi:hypothetical protein